MKTDKPLRALVRAFLAMTSEERKAMGQLQALAASLAVLSEHGAAHLTDCRIGQEESLVLRRVHLEPDEAQALLDVGWENVAGDWRYA